MEPIRCGFLRTLSDDDKKQIERLFDEIEEKPHVHIWSSWLPLKATGLQFRKCIDCGTREHRPTPAKETEDNER